MSTRPRSVLVGVAGGSASGKTTLTAALEAHLRETQPNCRLEVIGMDRYFYRGKAPGPMFTSPSSGEIMADNNHPDSADNARLVADLDARRIADDAPDLIVVEGLMALHNAEIRGRCDLRLFVELEADVRALRRMLRDMTGVRGSADPAFIATYYRECARVGHERHVEPSRQYADLVIRGDADPARVVPMLASVVRSLLPRPSA